MTAAHPLDDRARPLAPYEWSWSLHPSVLVGAALLAALYLWGVTVYRRRVGAPAVPAWRIASFGAGLAVLLLSLNGPIHDLSDYYLFSVHMLQHLLLTLLLPPLLLLGTPGWLVEPLLRPAPVRAVARRLTGPLPAGLLYTATIAFWHFVPFYDLMMRDHEVHVATHLMFIATATLMWWPVLSPTPLLPRLTLGKQMLYLFAVSVPMQLVAALITMTDTVLYTWYAEAPRTWGLSPLDDQKIGGLLMWVPGNLWMFGAISLRFFAWAKQEA
ncbi:MAG TPA: cytochrome c oxidase assembly protein [Gemmatimonadales bacterium]|nr:cytochrome c oxidase assembly protein [Gemmatimonadales bacterium]